MKRRVVDTNVLVVANGRNTNASLSCRLAAIEALKSLIDEGRIIIDTRGEISGEYRQYSLPAGQPGVGDEFFRLVLLDYSGKIERVELLRRDDGSFEDFPVDARLHNFDLSDRKFAAAARKSDSVVMNAVDSDWLDYLQPLEDHGIRSECVCGCDRMMWFEIAS